MDGKERLCSGGKLLLRFPHFSHPCEADERHSPQGSTQFRDAIPKGHKWMAKSGYVQDERYSAMPWMAKSGYSNRLPV